LSAAAAHALDDVPSPLALGDGFDLIEGELRPQQIFQLQLQYLTLTILGTLIGFPLKFIDLAAHLVHLEILFGELELMFLGVLGRSLLPNLLTPLIELACQFQFLALLTLLQFALATPQLQLLLVRGLKQPGVFIQSGFQVPHFDGH
jgi:hypothetical protein